MHFLNPYSPFSWDWWIALWENVILFIDVQKSPWSASLLGSSSSWTAYKNHWTQGQNCWCLQEALSLLFFEFSFFSLKFFRLVSYLLLWFSCLRDSQCFDDFFKTCHSCLKRILERKSTGESVKNRLIGLAGIINSQEF